MTGLNNFFTEEKFRVKLNMEDRYELMQETAKEETPEKSEVTNKTVLKFDSLNFVLLTESANKIELNIH